VLPPDREQTPENVALVTKYLEEGKKYYEEKEFEKAISKFQEAYGLAREIKHAEGEGEALTQMCLFYQRKGQLPRAKELGENAIEVLAGSTNKKSLGEARTALARVYLLQDNTYMAMQQLQLAMDSFNDLGATDAEAAADVVLLAADIAMRGGHVKEGLQMYEAAASLSGQAGKPKAQVYLQTRVSAMLLRMGFTTAALDEANKALNTARNTTKKPDEIVAALSAVGNAQYCLCEFAEARKTYEEALQTKVPGYTIIEKAPLIEAYAFSLAATGDTDQAKTQLEKILPVLTKDGTALDKAQTQNALGVIHSLQNNNGVAIQYFKDALDAAALITPRADRLQCLIMSNLAAAHSRAGQNRIAKTQYQDTISACTTKNYNDALLRARNYAGLAETCLNLKEYPDAETAARSGIAIAEQINDDASLWRLYTCLAEAQIAQGQPGVDSLNSAVSFFRSPQAGDFANPAELIYPTRRDEMGHRLVSQLVQSGLVEQALLAAEQLKEEAFINDWHRRGGEVRLADRDIYTDMVARRAHLHSTEGTGAAPSTVLKDWRDWVVRFQHIAVENPSLARLIAPVPINMQDVLKTLQANRAAVVDYLVGSKSTIAFTIDTNRRLTALRLPVGKDDLQAQVATLLTASTKSDESARATEHRILQLLYNELITAEVRQALPANPDQTVVVIPDSVLFNLPFAALISDNGKYLIESHTLTMAPELNVLMEIPHQTKDLSVLVASDRTGDQESEPGQIASIFDPTQVVTLSSKDAAINSLQEQAKSSSIIHLTASVNIAQNNPLRSVVPFASEDRSTSKVTANTLFDLNLPSDLAVLSGTSVNAKDYHGSGVQVFCRGLNYAGVRNVMMTLWAVPDSNRTSELVEFYKSRQQGLSQAQSLRKAQLLALSKDPSPRMWAAFQLLGPGF
jgi:CHAT domain-containing protein